MQVVGSHHPEGFTGLLERFTKGLVSPGVAAPQVWGVGLFGDLHEYD